MGLSLCRLLRLRDRQVACFLNPPESRTDRALPPPLVRSTVVKLLGKKIDSAALVVLHPASKPVPKIPVRAVAPPVGKMTENDRLLRWRNAQRAADEGPVLNQVRHQNLPAVELHEQQAIPQVSPKVAKLEHFILLKHPFTSKSRIDWQPGRIHSGLAAKPLKGAAECDVRLPGELREKCCLDACHEFLPIP